jgi:phosphoribosylformylglycinamidine cyclo-ligase
MDFTTRMEAARAVRRAEAAIAVPALIQAAASHTDWYVRYRALVLLSGFNDPRAREMMIKMLGEPNDRLRGVAYGWFEHYPDPAVLPRLLAAVDREDSEFVRPALTRALAAHGSDPKVQAVLRRLVMFGHDFFRAGVIEALGDHRGGYALTQIVEVSRLEGPLQRDAVLAIGRIGDTRGLAVLAELQQKAPRHLQPSIAAAICLLGSNCASHTAYLVETVRFSIVNPGYQDLLRAAAGGLAALALSGHAEAATILFERGAPTQDPQRAAIVLALGNIALRNTPLMLDVLEQQTDLHAATELLREAFDMLDEDFEEEQFFVTVRRAYWAAPEGGVDIDAGNEVVRRIRSLAQATFTPGVLSDMGSFGGLFHWPVRISATPVLVASADGVGTKLKVAFMTGVHDDDRRRSGQPLRQRHPRAGREPLFFLDYLATGRLSPDVAEQIVEGLARPAARTAARCSAARPPRCRASTPMASTISPASSSARRARPVIDGRSGIARRRADRLPSSGLHTNGYSLARRIAFEVAALDPSARVPELGCRSATRCWCPHRSYLPVVRPLLGSASSRGWRTSPGAVITENVPRMRASGS